MAPVKCSSSPSEKNEKMMVFEEKHFQNQQQLPFYDDRSSNITSLYHTDMNEDPTFVKVKRPTTRRNPNDLPPPQENLKPRSLSNGNVGHIKIKNNRKLNAANSTKSCSTGYLKNKKSNVLLNKISSRVESASDPSKLIVENTAKIPTSPTSSSSSYVKKSSTGNSTRSNNKVEEHEYLQFLLRVTEDIILYNYYANEDIERVFKKHMDLNKDRLVKEKMEQHLAKLADELNISDVKTSFDIENSSTLSKPHPTYTNIQSLKPYECECTFDGAPDMYMSSSNNYNYYNQSYQNNLDEIIYYRHSLGRVTECTEPSNSSTTLTKAVSINPTESNITMENVEINDSNRKLYETRSEVFNPNRNNSEDSLLPFKMLRCALSENIVHNHDLLEPAKAEEMNPIVMEISEKSRLNENPEVINIEEDSISFEDDKDFSTEKDAHINEINKNLEYKTCKLTSGKTDKSETNSEKSGFITERSNVKSSSTTGTDNMDIFNTENNPPNKSKINTGALYTNTNRDKDYNEHLRQNPDTKGGLARFENIKSINYQWGTKSDTERTTITKKVSTTEYSGFSSERSDCNGESSDINTDRVDDTFLKSENYLIVRPQTKRSKFGTGNSREETTGYASDINTNGNVDIGDYNAIKNMFDSDKNVAAKGDFKADIYTIKHDMFEIQSENKEKSDADTGNSKRVLAAPKEMKGCEIGLNLMFTNDSIENTAIDPDIKNIDIEPHLISTRSRESAKGNLTQDLAIPDGSLKNNFKEHYIPIRASNPLKEVHKSVQTSYHNFIGAEGKTEMESKCTQMSCSLSNKACCTNDDDVPINNSDYVLITSPIFVLKSMLNSQNKIIIEKEKFLGEKVTDQINEIEKNSDIDSDATTIDLKLLSSDYDLTPERDTSDKYHYLMADVATSMTHIQIPSLSSIRDENLLLGNLYELHDSTSQEFEINKEWELGSSTYRCADKTKAKAFSCDEDIFIRNSEVIVNKNWLSDKSEIQKPSPKKRINKVKHVRATVNICNSTSSTSLTY